MNVGRTLGLDASHDPSRRSWVASAHSADTDFPLQNLPLGIFSPADGQRRSGVAIGDQILDLAACASAGLLPRDVADTLSDRTLNRLLSLGNAAIRALRNRLVDLLDERHPEKDKLVRLAGEVLFPADRCTVHMPVTVGNFSDFFAGIHHAKSAGMFLNPDKPLADNYKWLPVAYHGRPSSVVPSGVDLRRPCGQRVDAPGARPVYGPSWRLDIELEMGMFVGRGNPLGEPIPVGEAGDHVSGFCLLNDWSARDIQFWEMTPLGPFLGKNFGTTISSWIVTTEALRPFRIPVMEREPGDPRPLQHLFDPEDQISGGIDVALQVLLQSSAMREAGLPAEEIIASNSRYLYWTPAQMIAHHASSGCNLQPGDLVGTGTLSGPTPSQLSSLLELTQAGANPFTLKNGESRAFVEDGDEVTLLGRASREGFVSIGFGACTSRITRGHLAGDVT
jgi:fumarylacetoacetase